VRRFSKGVICEVIDNGEDSIKAKRKHYDLVLMDVHLPGINGTIATQRGNSTAEPHHCFNCYLA
jgi:CheY-like chemotaxis protein